MYIVIVGANDGRAPDPVYLLYASGACGVLVEVDEGIFKVLLENRPWERCGRGRRPERWRSSWCRWGCRAVRPPAGLRGGRPALHDCPLPRFRP